MIALAMFATIAPWIARNAVLFGNPQIAAGTDVSVLGIRMLLMEQPLVGQLYLYSPDAFKKRLVGPLTGYGEDDLKPGGRLEGASTAKANRHAIFAERIEDEGYQGDQSKWVKGKVFSYVVEHPLRYIASIGVFAYKAMWFMTRAGPQFNLLALLCFFGIFFGALFTRDQVLLAAFGLPAGLFFFIAIFTHALTRYTSPMTPFVILSVLWLFAALARRAYRRFPRFRALVDPCLRLIQPAERCEKLEPAAPHHADIERRDGLPRLSGKPLAQGLIGHHALKLCRQRGHVARLDQQAIFAAFEDFRSGAWAIGGDHRTA